MAAFRGASLFVRIAILLLLVCLGVLFLAASIIARTYASGDEDDSSSIHIQLSELVS